MSQRFLSIVCATAVLGAALAAPAASRVTSLKQLNYIVGTWNCSNGHQTSTQTWAYVLDGAFLRGTDRGKETVEHALRVEKDGSVTVIDMFSNGMWEVMHGTGSSGHAAFHSVFPANVNTNVVFNRVSATKFTVDATGSSQGKPFKDHDVCTKA